MKAYYSTLLFFVLAAFLVSNSSAATNSANSRRASFSVQQIEAQDLNSSPENIDFLGLWRDFIQSGGEGRIFKITLSPKIREVFKSVAKVIEGPIIVVDRPPLRLLPSGGSVFNHDSTVINELNKMHHEGVPLLAIPVQRGMHAGVLDTQLPFIKKLIEIAYPQNTEVHYFFIFSQSLNQDLLIHERTHIEQKAQNSSYRQFMQEVILIYSKNELRAFGDFAAELEAYRAQINFLKNSHKESFFSLSIGQDQENDYSPVSTPIDEHKKHTIEDVKEMVRFYAKPVQKILENLQKKNSMLYCHSLHMLKRYYESSLFPLANIFEPSWNETACAKSQ